MNLAIRKSKNRDELAHSIFSRIIEKGAMLGHAAKVYYNDKKNVSLFIQECAIVCHTKVANEFWGADLIADIKKYVRNVPDLPKVTALELNAVETIKSIRKEKGIKQEVIADSLSMSQSNYSKIEKGLISPTLGQLELITKILDLTVIDLLDIAHKRTLVENQ